MLNPLRADGLRCPPPPSMVLRPATATSRGPPETQNLRSHLRPPEPGFAFLEPQVISYKHASLRSSALRYVCAVTMLHDFVVCDLAVSGTQPQGWCSGALPSAPLVLSSTYHMSLKHPPGRFGLNEKLILLEKILHRADTQSCKLREMMQVLTPLLGCRCLSRTCGVLCSTVALKRWDSSALEFPAPRPSARHVLDKVLQTAVLACSA